MSPKQVEDHVKDRIIKLRALEDAVNQVVECAEPIHSGNSSDPIEYVVAAEEY